MDSGDESGDESVDNETTENSDTANVEPTMDNESPLDHCDSTINVV